MPAAAAAVRGHWPSLPQGAQPLERKIVCALAPRAISQPDSPVPVRNRSKDIPCWCTILCCTIFPVPGFCKSFESNVTVAPSGGPDTGVVPGGPDSITMER